MTKTPLKRFLLFAHRCYEATGGMSDLVNSYDTIEECLDVANSEEYDFYDCCEIYDLASACNIALTTKAERKWIVKEGK